MLIYDFRLDKTGSISMMDDNGDCHVALDEKQIENSADRKVKLAHELGHCVLSAFYNRYSKFDLITQHEYRANRWAVEELLPFYRLRKALETGHIEIWDLAEFLELTEDFIKIAIEHYERQGLLPIYEELKRRGNFKSKES